ncbi:MAG: low molecular weight protein-tyrosine-phosphatase [Phycisphaerales bacterium]
MTPGARTGTDERVGVLFVCLGNICRSPLAEGIFIHLARERDVLGGFHVDSCGTGGWHVGGPADHRSIAVARRHGIELTSVARRFEPERDLVRFRWLIPMDRSNARSLLAGGAEPARVRLMRSFDPALAGRPEDELDVPDPYEWPGDGFEETYRMLRSACEGMLAKLMNSEA